MIAALEDAVISAAQTALGAHVRTVISLPGPWSLDLLRRMFQDAPAVYVTWLGGKARDTNMPVIDARLDVLAVTKNARGEQARRRGGPNTIGAYHIIQALVPALNDLDVTDIGSLALVEIRNVFDQATFEVGATVYAAQFRVAMDLTPADGAADLAEFLTYDEVHHIGDQTDEQTVDLSPTWK